MTSQSLAHSAVVSAPSSSRGQWLCCYAHPSLSWLTLSLPFRAGTLSSSLSSPNTHTPLFIALTSQPVHFTSAAAARHIVSLSSEEGSTGGRKGMSPLVVPALGGRGGGKDVDLSLRLREGERERGDGGDGEGSGLGASVALRRAEVSLCLRQHVPATGVPEVWQ